ncbi:hypothetical protein A2U01_0109989, partial [Trifolium medium]|nr:hypothetical protein [Trifolium medium]
QPLPWGRLARPGENS